MDRTIAFDKRGLPYPVHPIIRRILVQTVRPLTNGSKLPIMNGSHKFVNQIAIPQILRDLKEER